MVSLGIQPKNIAEFHNLLKKNKEYLINLSEKKNFFKKANELAETHDSLKLMTELFIKYKSNICNIALKASGAVLTPEETIELNNSQRALRRTRYAAGLRAHAATVPVFRLPGPLPLPVIFTGSYGKIHILGNGRRHYS